MDIFLVVKKFEDKEGMFSEDTIGHFKYNLVYDWLTVANYMKKGWDALKIGGLVPIQAATINLHTESPNVIKPSTEPTIADNVSGG